MRVTAFCNQKGGVGKTTVAVGVAETLARRGRRVLLIDADPQANATAHLGVELTESTPTLSDVLYVDAAAGSTVEAGVAVEAITDAGGAWADLVDVIPAKLGLANREQDQQLGRELRLRTAMAGDELPSRYDDVVIDCPPSLGQLTANALLAATHVVCVTEPRASSVEGLRQMIAVIDQVRAAYGWPVRLTGIAVNRFRADRTDPVAWAGKLVDEHGDRLIEPFVAEREFVAKAATEAVPLGLYPGVPGLAKLPIERAFEAVVDRLDAVR